MKNLFKNKYTIPLYRFIKSYIYSVKRIKYCSKLGFNFIGTREMEDNNFEPNESRFFDSILNHFDCFLNVGANYGYYTCKALHKNKNVVCFEPNELNFRILLRNINANKFRNAIIFNGAASSESNTTILYGGATGASLIKGWSYQYNGSVVASFRYDDIQPSVFTGKPIFALIDIEGAEHSFLKGSRSLLENRKNIFLIEICFDEHTPDKINKDFYNVFELFHQYSYSMFSLSKNLSRIDLNDVHECIRTSTNIFKSHNFIFCGPDVDPHLINKLINL